MSLIRRNNPTLLTTLSKTGALGPMISAVPALAQVGAQAGAQVVESVQQTRRVGMQCHHGHLMAQEETRREEIHAQDAANHRAHLSEALRGAQAPEERAALIQALTGMAPRPR